MIVSRKSLSAFSGDKRKAAIKSLFSSTSPPESQSVSFADSGPLLPPLDAQNSVRKTSKIGDDWGTSPGKKRGSLSPFRLDMESLRRRIFLC